MLFFFRFLPVWILLLNHRSLGSALSSSHTLSTRDNDTILSSELSASFASSSWIWSPDSIMNDTTGGPNGTRVFRRTFTSPNNQTAQSAVIVITCDDGYLLFVNGAPIGASADAENTWFAAQKYIVALNATTNVFAVEAINRYVSSAGLLAAIEISYTGTAGPDYIQTDDSWKSSTAIYNDFQLPNFDDSAWPAAEVVATYGSGEWGSQVFIPNGKADITLDNSTWLWNQADYTDSPAESIGFLKVVSASPGKTYVGAKVLVSVDNTFILYLNGVEIGGPPNTTDSWNFAQRFTIQSGVDASQNVFAILATNYPAVTTGENSAAGLIATIEMIYTDGSIDVIPSDDTTWFVTEDLSGNWTTAISSSEQWSLATGIALYNTSGIVWGTLGIADSLALNSDLPPYLNSSQSTSTTSIPSSSPSSGVKISNHKTITGAIVGGVVGGIIFLGSVVLALILLRRRRNNPRGVLPTIDPYFPQTYQIASPPEGKRLVPNGNTLSASNSDTDVGDEHHRTLSTPALIELLHRRLGANSSSALEILESPPQYTQADPHL